MTDANLTAPRSREVRLTDRNLRFSRLPEELACGAVIVVAIAFHDQGDDLRQAITSALEQDTGHELVAILVLDDESEDGWQKGVSDLLTHPRVAVAHGCCGSAAHARNALLDIVDDAFPRACWVARLDADDRLATKTSLSSLVDAGRRSGSDFVVGSNYLSRRGIVFGSLNRADPTVLLDRDRLTAFISAFCSGESEHELPSCNLLLRARSGIRYPLIRSAEDHWLVAGLLMFRADRGCVVADPAYAVYSIDGQETRHNQSDNTWRVDRMRLKNAARLWRDVLASGTPVLGWGNEGIVWEEKFDRRKRFYPGAITAEALMKIEKLARASRGAIIPFQIQSLEADERPYGSTRK